MPRPCHADHSLQPDLCRLCWWACENSDKGRAYRRLWGEPEPEPGFLRKATNFLGALIQHYAQGAPEVSEAVYQTRLRICRGFLDLPACVLFDKDRDTCRHPGCGCNMMLKAKWGGDVKCPLGKW